MGEGSGKRRDTDKYDDDYLHLILWDENDLEIVGAYRFMPTAQQVEARGIEGLYSHSLFHYDDRMADVLRNGIELGRSFIQPRYWGRRGLDYLWSGIGAYRRGIRNTATCLARCRFLAVCRLRQGICWSHSTVCGSRQLGHWPRHVARGLPPCRTYWRSLPVRITPKI